MSKNCSEKSRDILFLIDQSGENCFATKKSLGRPNIFNVIIFEPWPVNGKDVCVCMSFYLCLSKDVLVCPLFVEVLYLCFDNIL